MLEGDEASRFQWKLDAVKSAEGRCLGSQGILLAINKVQNAILEHISLGLHDSGSESTSRYQESATLSIDAPFAQNDLFYANVGRSLITD